MHNVRPFAAGLAVVSALVFACARDTPRSASSDDTGVGLAALEKKVAACAESYDGCDAGAGCDDAFDACKDDALAGAGSAADAVGECTGALRTCLAGDGEVKACISTFHGCMGALQASRDAAVKDHDADLDEDTDADLDEDTDAALDEDTDADLDEDTDAALDEDTDAGSDEASDAGADAAPSDAGKKGGPDKDAGMACTKGKSC
jgi:hypothetical protein